MKINLKNRNFLTLLDFTPKEIKYLLQLSAELKKAKYEGREVQTLKRKNIAGTDNRKILIYPGDTVLVQQPRIFNWAKITN